MRRLAFAAGLLAACSGSSGSVYIALSMVPEPAGANCANGGVKLSTGSVVDYVCNGTNGNGSLTVATEPAGANCTSGGVKLTSMSGANYVCNGSGGGGVTTASEPAGANCAAGGVKITSSSGTNYVCNGTGGSGTAKAVVDSGGSVLGQFLSMYAVPDYVVTSTPYYHFSVLYEDGAGVLVPRRPDGTLDPFLVQQVYFSNTLCQGTPYSSVQGSLASSAGLPVGVLLQIGIPINPNAGQSRMTQPDFFRVMSAAPTTLSPASVLDYNGNCAVNSASVANLYTLAVVTAPAATVPGPLGIQ